MATTITNNGASLKIDNGTQVRNLMKSQIIEISVIKTNVIKFDIGQGPLHNVFVPYAEVTEPVAASPEALRDALNEMMASSLASGTATEAKQIEEINSLKVANEQLAAIKTSVNALDNKIFFDPVLIDEGNPNVIYKGFASPSAKQDEAVWAIQKITHVNDVCSYQWADGNKNFDNIWNNRAELTYA